MLVISTLVVGGILVLALTWDVSKKATYVLTQDDRDKEAHDDHVCRGGICWHGVAVKSPASQLRFRLGQRQHH